MNISIFTQNEDFFLKKNFEDFVLKLPGGVNITSVFLCSASPFGEKLNIFEKFLKTIKIFGFRFTLRYSIKFCKNKFFQDSIKDICFQNSIKVFEINDFKTSSIKYLKKSNLDLIVSIACPIILNKEILNIPSLGCINIHCSMLPRYRGLMPSFWVLLNQEKYTGISIFKMNQYVDDGPIIFQKKIRIDANISLEQLIIKTKRLSFRYLNDVLKKYLKKEVSIINDNKKNLGSYFSFPTRNDIILFKKNNNFY